jgi:dTDP-4-dehydrorhamnose 3,5-epimerase
VVLIDPPVFADERGFFMETFHGRKYAEQGIDRTFVQDNHSHSCRSTLRGLHYQLDHPQGKLVYAVTGEIFDVAVDIRRGSPTFGRWVGTTLSAQNKRQIYVPEGFAHGFCVLSEEADVIYKCTDLYAPEDEYGILWLDTQIGIEWPVDSPLLSPKDSRNPTLEELPEKHLPVYG